MALPLLVAVTIGLVWLLAVGARRSARRRRPRDRPRRRPGRRHGAAVARGERVAPAGSQVTVTTTGPRSAPSSPAGGRARAGCSTRCPG